MEGTDLESSPVGIDSTVPRCVVVRDCGRGEGFIYTYRENFRLRSPKPRDTKVENLNFQREITKQQFNLRVMHETFLIPFPV